jgi:hypothetical protein
MCQLASIYCAPSTPEKSNNTRPRSNEAFERLLGIRRSIRRRKDRRNQCMGPRPAALVGFVVAPPTNSSNKTVQAAKDVKQALKVLYTLLDDRLFPRAFFFSPLWRERLILPTKTTKQAITTRWSRKDAPLTAYMLFTIVHIDPRPEERAVSDSVAVRPRQDFVEPKFCTAGPGWDTERER